MIARETTRARAEDGLMILDVVYSAMAATQCKSGHALLKRTAKRLEKAAK